MRDIVAGDGTTSIRCPAGDQLEHAVHRAACELLRQILAGVGVGTNDVVMVLIACGDDVRETYPARGLRAAGLDRAALLDVIGWGIGARDLHILVHATAPSPW